MHVSRIVCHGKGSYFFQRKHQWDLAKYLSLLVWTQEAPHYWRNVAIFLAFRVCGGWHSKRPQNAQKHWNMWADAAIEQYDSFSWIYILAKWWLSAHACSSSALQVHGRRTSIFIIFFLASAIDVVVHSGIWIIIGETFPTRSRAKQGALSTAANWLFVSS